MTCKPLSNIAGICQRLKKPQVFHRYREPGIAVTLLRWLTLLVYGWMGAVVVYLLWPWLSYLRPERLFSLADNPGLYGLLQITWSLVAVLLVLTLQDKFFIRFPRKCQSGYRIDIPTFLRYPTLHVSVVTGIILLLSAFNDIPSEMLNFPVSVKEKDTKLVPGLAADGLGIFFWLYAFVLAVRTEYRIRTAAAEASQLKSKETLDLLACSDDQFRSWLLKEEDTKTLDFFKREPYVTRMLGRIKSPSSNEVPQENGQQKSKGQVLLGEFGSGKTSIVNLLEKELDPEWIVSRFDCWQRSGKPQELAAQLMEQIIHDVGQQVEAASLVGLPESFASALYGSSHWWQLLDIWLRPDTPEQVMGKLDALLKANNRKLLLVIENVDRNEEREHFINIIAAILDKLQQSKNLNHIDFIFSADEARLDKELLYRIADYRERVATFISPELLIRFMALCLDSALSKQDDGESLIIPYLSKDFLLPDDAQRKIEAVKNAFGIQSNGNHYMSPASPEYQVLMALTNILSNPRRLKHVLRDMYQRWMDELKGEVNLFDLLLYCTANDEGSIRKSMEQFTPEMLDSPDYDPYTFDLSKKLKQRAGESTEGIPSYSDADVIAFYLLNGHIVSGRPCREICQPVIDEGGVSEESFTKYRKGVDIGVVGGYATSDQEFLKNYIKASAVICDKKSLKFCLDSLQKDWNISKNLLKNMTIQYFSSVRELHQFLYNTIVFADEKYVGTFPGALEELIHLCFEVMNFDGSGGEQNSLEFQRKLIAALEQLDEHKHYSYLMRVLSFLLWSGADNHFSQVVTAVIETMFTHQLSVRLGLCFRGGHHKGTHELQYEYIHFLPALNEALHLINRDTFNEACRSFLIVTGIGLVDEPTLLYQFAQRYKERLAEIKGAIQQAVKTNVPEGIELKAWKELQRVLQDKSDDSAEEQEQD